ncbi:hypothetical protein AB6A40_008207 [Gnathostoma spinigerum]|uniref:AAA+ ATPase domain-containing protein n=1 Tax=Gnathostoma spinigerum TaxID=75299 RepID=A0ABD6ENQ1_9BILA
MTLRDVFRWAKRLAVSEYTDWQQCLSDHGYFLLGARCRNTVDECLVIRTLEKYLKRSINPDALFDSRSPYFPKTVSENEQHSNIVLTAVMRRMIVLCYQAWLCNEPVLLVGETGCGKTTVAELLAKIWKKKLFCLNCHQHTETSDLLGSLRPVGNGTFKWVDGVVIEAMKKGHPLLIDEISLAADSVLERLNPLLETSRTLLLTDAGTSADVIYCSDGFEVIATMNPGGDYGKKEVAF